MAHPNKDIRNAIEYAESKGFRYIEGGKSHLKGVLQCVGGRGACRIPVYGTPRNTGDHAKNIRRDVQPQLREIAMSKFSFEITLANQTTASDDLAEATFEAGCDDATMASRDADVSP